MKRLHEKMKYFLTVIIFFIIITEFHCQYGTCIDGTAFSDCTNCINHKCICNTTSGFRNGLPCKTISDVSLIANILTILIYVTLYKKSK
jgi:hypothetical protein